MGPMRYCRTVPSESTPWTGASARGGDRVDRGRAPQARENVL